MDGPTFHIFRGYCPHWAASPTFRGTTTLVNVTAAPAAPWGRNFLARPLPLTLVFSSFFFITVPLVALEHAHAFDDWRVSPTFVYVAVMGMSHFLITFPVYLNSTNLEHFTGTWFNRFMYFVVPVLIVVVIAVVYGMRGFERSAGLLGLVSFWVFAFLRGLDFYHVLRQSFGVFELTKSQVKLRYTPSAKNMSRAFFMAMFLLQFHTFTHDKAFHADAISIGLIAVATALFLALMGVLVHRLVTASPEDRSYAWVPIAYLMAQGLCAVLVAYRSIFYLASLAMHYTEYHVLMQPRVFANLGTKAKVDRFMQWCKRHQLVFYGVLVAASVFFYMGPTVFNGFKHPMGNHGWIYWLFIIQTMMATLHFYVDALLWRFGNPFYQKTLGPIYFKR